MGKWGGGVGAGNREFCGPCEIARADRRVQWGPLFIIRCYTLCGTRLLSATRPSILINGCQGHPPFLPVTWDRPAATEPGSETVYTRNTFIQSTFVESLGQCEMRLKPENRKYQLTMIYVHNDIIHTLRHLFLT